MAHGVASADALIEHEDRGNPVAALSRLAVVKNMMRCSTCLAAALRERPRPSHWLHLSIAKNKVVVLACKHFERRPAVGADVKVCQSDADNVRAPFIASPLTFAARPARP